MTDPPGDGMVEPPVIAVKRSGVRAATLRLSTQISLATLLGLVVSLVARLVSARLLGPGSYGLLRAADLVQQYAGYADLGAKLSVSRQVSLLLGRGRREEARQIASLLGTWAILVALAVTLVLWGLFFSGVSLQGLLTLPNVIVLTLILAANRINAYLANYVRSYGEFDSVGTQFFITALLPPLALIPGVYWLGVTGGLLSQLLVAVLVTLNLVRYAARLDIFRLQWLVDWRRMLDLLRLSVLLQANAISEMLFESLEVTLLLVFLPIEQVGIYAFAIGWMGSTLSGQAGIRMVVERAMLLEPRDSAGRPRYAQYARYMRAPLVVNVFGTAVALGSLYFAFDWVVGWFLPAFGPAMVVAQVLILGQVIYAATSFPRLYFNATDQLKSRLVFALGGLGLNVALDLALLFAGYGIIGVAIGSTISYVLYAALLVPACTQQINGRIAPGVSFVVRLVVASTVTVAALVALSGWSPVWASVSQAGAWRWIAGILLVAVKVSVYAAATAAIYSLAFWPYRPDREMRVLVRHFLSGGRPLSG